jgi:non-homologous end joining protein Ku
MRANQTTQLTVTTVLDEATGTEIPKFAFPVQICKATGSVDVKFDRAAPSGAAYDTVYRDQATGEVVEYGDLVRGVRTGDSFAVIPDEQIEAIDEAVSMPDIRVERSLPLEDVPFDRVTGRYFLQSPAKGGLHKWYRLTQESLAAQPKKGNRKARPAMALQVKFTSRTRQKLGVVFADEERNCLVLLTLTFAADLRSPDEAVLAPTLVEVEDGEVEMARKVIEGLNGEVDFDAPVDEAIEQKRDLIEKAAGGETIEVAAVPEADAVDSDDLKAVLQASMPA